MKKRLAIAAAALAVAVAPYGASALQVSAAASGNNTVTTEPEETPEQAGYRRLKEEFDAKIVEAVAGESGTVRITKEDDIQTFSISMMRKLSNSNVSLKMEYTYKGVDYSITIPAGGFEIDPDIPWYGPLWLAAHYAD